MSAAPLTPAAADAAASLAGETGPVNALLTALAAAVAADADLLALIGGDGLRDRRLLRAGRPGLTVGAVEVEDLSTDDDGLIAVTVTLEAWSSLGRREAESMIHRLRRRLAGAPLRPAGATLLALRPRDGTSRRDDKTGLHLASLRLRALLLPDG